MAYTYILECGDGSYYTGSTINLARRVRLHQIGKGAKYTRSHAPVRLVYVEAYPTVGDARRREKEIQRWNHRQKKALVESRLHEPAAQTDT